MRVALIHPAGSNFVPGKRDVTVVANRMPPLGILGMASVLEREGHDVVVHDCLGPRAPKGMKANVRAVLDARPDLVGFSATTSAFLDAYDMASAIKEARPSVLTVFGGVHVSAVGGALLGRFLAIDCLVVGEGELTLAELVQGRPLREIDGLVWRDGEEIVVNAPRALAPDLDSLPMPAYEKLEGFPRGYALPPFSYVRSPGATLVTSRGCVYRCSYCDRSVFGRGFRYNSAEHVYEHMRLLRTRFGVRHVNVYDDLFTTNRARIARLCGMLADRPLGLRFNCAVRVGHTDDELLGMLKEAGCLMVSVGIESGDPALLERHKTGVGLDEVRDTVARIQAKGIRAKGLFMMGLPGETEAAIARTSDFIMSLGLDDMNMSKFTPFPGAPVWETIREEGTFDEDWRLMNCLNFVFVPKGIESKERLDLLYNRHVKRFYCDPAWRAKLRGRLWQHRATLWRMLVHLPSFLAAKRHFEPGRSP
ncbi:MAG: radical SAM protein [Deltaproteobacteria bacterium]|nr:radical SAM protein [Deltaproteobacteria bacterium]